MFSKLTKITKQYNLTEMWPDNDGDSAIINNVHTLHYISSYNYTHISDLCVSAVSRRLPVRPSVTRVPKRLKISNFSLRLEAPSF